MYLEINAHNPVPGQEYLAAAYPRPGAYLLPDGRLALVNNNMVFVVMQNNVPNLTNGLEGLSAQNLLVTLMLLSSFNSPGSRLAEALVEGTIEQDVSRAKKIVKTILETTT